ncbi:hypothetical protein ACJRO7_026553 [Eucalyptus globulus]|uniref:Uncharacterized protein n=1 Tax=Eucalyptus globulus TaxID=34317 RepID=A0ABD3JQZ5_EUCGL
MASQRKNEEEIFDTVCETSDDGREPESGIYWNLDQGWVSESLSHGNGGPIRHPHLFQRRHRETAHMIMGLVNGSGWASMSSHVTRITHLRLCVNKRPNYGYSFQGGAGPDEHYHPFSRGMNNIQPLPNVEVVMALNVNVQLGDGVDDPEDIISDGEESDEDF